MNPKYSTSPKEGRRLNKISPRGFRANTSKTNYNKDASEEKVAVPIQNPNRRPNSRAPNKNTSSENNQSRSISPGPPLKDRTQPKLNQSNSSLNSNQSISQLPPAENDSEKGGESEHQDEPKENLSPGKNATWKTTKFANGTVAGESNITVQGKGEKHKPRKQQQQNSYKNKNISQEKMYGKRSE